MTCPPLSTLFSISAQSNEGIPERRHLVGPQNTLQRGARLELGFHLLHKYPVFPQTHWSPRVSNEPQEEGALLRKWETVKVDSDQKATPPNALCSKTGPIGKSEQGGRAQRSWKKSEFKRSSRLSRMLSLPACDLPRDADGGENLRLFCLPSKPLFLLDFTTSWRLGGVN